MTNDDVLLSYLDAEVSTIEEEAEKVRTYRDYYSGDHPTYLTDRQKEFLALSMDYAFALNYCEPVVLIPAERLDVQGFNGADDSGEKLAARAWQWFEQNEMDQAQDGLFVAALRDGLAFIIVDWDSDSSRPRWVVNYAYDGTRGVRVNYHPDTNEVMSATKYWHEYDPDTPGATGTPRRTVYYEDRVERYRAGKDGWELVEVINWKVGNQPLGLAVIPFDNPGGSELSAIIPVQDMINKTALDLVGAADTAGFGLTYVSGVTPQYNADGTEKDLQVDPGRLLRLENPQARLDRVPPDDLTKLVATLDAWVVHLAAITRTPQYLLQRWGAQPPSGESLKSQEIGLVSKCGKKTRTFGGAWKKVVRLSAKLHNLYGSQERLDSDALLRVTWAPVEMRNEGEVLDNAQKKVNLGVPREQVWSEDLGYDQTEIAGFGESADADRQRAMGELVQKMASVGGNVDVPEHE